MRWPKMLIAISCSLIAIATTTLVAVSWKRNKDAENKKKQQNEEHKEDNNEEQKNIYKNPSNQTNDMQNIQCIAKNTENALNVPTDKISKSSKLEEDLKKMSDEEFMPLADAALDDIVVRLKEAIIELMYSYCVELKSTTDKEATIQSYLHKYDRKFYRFLLHNGVDSSSFMILMNNLGESANYEEILEFRNTISSGAVPPILLSQTIPDDDLLKLLPLYFLAKWCLLYKQYAADECLLIFITDRTKLRIFLQDACNKYRISSYSQFTEPIIVILTSFYTSLLSTTNESMIRIKKMDDFIMTVFETKEVKEFEIKLLDIDLFALTLEETVQAFNTIQQKLNFLF